MRLFLSSKKKSKCHRRKQPKGRHRLQSNQAAAWRGWICLRDIYSAKMVRCEGLMNTGWRRQDLSDSRCPCDRSVTWQPSSVSNALNPQRYEFWSLDSFMLPVQTSVYHSYPWISLWFPLSCVPVGCKVSGGDTLATGMTETGFPDSNVEKDS